MKPFSAVLLILAGHVLLATAVAAPRETGPSVVQHHSHKSRPARRSPARNRQSTDIDAFVRALRARGLTVGSAGEVSQPFFTPEGRAFTVAGENVQVFRYPSARAAEAEAKKVNAEGTAVGTSSAMWVGPPHFHRKDRLIVLHVGSDAAVREALVSLLGPQFAGK